MKPETHECFGGDSSYSNHNTFDNFVSYLDYHQLFLDNCSNTTIVLPTATNWSSTFKPEKGN
jgi:hypothetical protein